MTMQPPKKRRLGRGLEALLGPVSSSGRPDDDFEPRILPMSSDLDDSQDELEPATGPAPVRSQGAALGTPDPLRARGTTPYSIPSHTATPSPSVPQIQSGTPLRPGSLSNASTVPAPATAPWQADMSDRFDAVSGSRSSESEPGEGALVYLDVDRIQENPFQPRREFGEAELASLAESLKEHDMLQPILVRRVQNGYQIISGERRWRASQLAGWTKIPARIRQADDRLVAELAIVENLQRKDLNPLEKALSFKRYLEEHDCSQEDLASRLKIDRSTIANLIRLLDLPAVIQDSIRSGALSAGHARALLPLGDSARQIEFSVRIQRETWSVRDTERRVQEAIAAEERPEATANRRQPRRSLSPQIQSLEQQLRRALGTSVEIKSSSKGKGKIVIHFSSNDEFMRLRARLTDDGSPDDLRRVG